MPDTTKKIGMRKPKPIASSFVRTIGSLSPVLPRR